MNTTIFYVKTVELHYREVEEGKLKKQLMCLVGKQKHIRDLDKFSASTLRVSQKYSQ